MHNTLAFTCSVAQYEVYSKSNDLDLEKLLYVHQEIRKPMHLLHPLGEQCNPPNLETTHTPDSRIHK